VNLFEKLRRDAGKMPWGAVLSVAVEGLHSKTDSARSVVDQLRDWGALLTKNALMKWSMNLAKGERCESPDVSSGSPRRCRYVAPLTCDVCSRPCCLAHARVDFYGDAICEVCIGEAKARQRGGAVPPRPSAMTPAEAFRIFGLRPSVDFSEVKRRYKKLVFELSPDRTQDALKKETRTKRLKKVNAAFVVLSRHFEEKEKAA
jgi:DnaJ-domain-containing protein 1